MGFAAAFPYESPARIFREHAALSAFENEGRRGLDLGRLVELSDACYKDMAPVQWPARADGAAGKPFADGRLYSDSGKARMIPIAAPASATQRTDEYPLVLNSGRIRDQWHTMTRSARSPRLNNHLPEPFVHVHPVDAAVQGLEDGGLARVSSRWGRMLARVAVDRDQRPGSRFVPMHGSDAQSRQGRADALVNPARDPVSGQPEFKHTPARIESFGVRWHGFALARDRLRMEDAEYCAAIRGDGFWRYELAGTDPVPDWAARARACLGNDGEWLDFADLAHGRYRGVRASGTGACGAVCS